MARKKSTRWNSKKARWEEEVTLEDVTKDVIIDVKENEKGGFEIINNNIVINSKPVVNSSEVDYCGGVGCFPSHDYYD